MYCTKTQLQMYLGVSIAAGLDTYITSLITMSEQWINARCNRWFEDNDEAATRYYNGNGLTKIVVDDLRELTTLVVDNITLVEGEDFYTYPLNASADGVPFEWIELIQPETQLGAAHTNSRMANVVNYIFEKRQKNIVATGKWGYSTGVPATINVATLRLIAAVVKENVGDTDLKEINSESLLDYNVSYGKMSEIANKLRIGEMLEPFVKDTKALINKDNKGTIMQVS